MTAAGFKGRKADDCVCRAIAIATEQPYRTISAIVASSKTQSAPSKEEIEEPLQTSPAPRKNPANVRLLALTSCSFPVVC
jgi:hypothetical protein